MTVKLDSLSDVPLHQQLKDLLVGMITSGAIRPGEQMPTEQRMCGIYGIGRSTLRHALSSLENEGYIERTRGKGTFIRELAIHKTPGAWAGVVGSGLDSPLVTEILDGAEDVLSARGLGLRFFPSHDEAEATDKMIMLAVDKGAVGLLVYPAEDTVHSSRIKVLTDKGYPICLFDRALLYITTDCVMTDNVSAGAIATEHLISHGHRRIAFATPSSLNTYSVGRRYDGYVSALRLVGLEPDGSLLGNSPGDRAEWMGRVKARLGSIDRPTGVIAGNDRLAEDVIKTALGLGLRVPEDLAVVGFDNSYSGARFMVPLTSVSQPLRMIGHTAASIMLDRMDGNATDFRWRLLSPDLVVRQSSGGNMT